MSGRLRNNIGIPLPEGSDAVASRRLTGLCECDLRAQNAQFEGTGGVSRNNRRAGFEPAYHDTVTGRTCVSRFADGRPAPLHVLEGLPDEWIDARDAEGRPVRLAPAIVAGFVRDGCFFTREAAASTLAAQNDQAP